jgi:hypothetical protein
VHDKSVFWYVHTGPLQGKTVNSHLFTFDVNSTVAIIVNAATPKDAPILLHFTLL